MHLKKDSSLYSGLFKSGVSKKSRQLAQFLSKIDKILRAMEQRKDLKQFAKDDADMVKSSIAELRKARRSVYRSLEKLNFPVPTRDQKEKERFRSFWKLS